MFLAHSFLCFRDPWQCEALPGGGGARLRVFHRPTGLEDDDALWLVCSLLPPGAAVSFNGGTPHSAAHDGPHQYDVTARLTDANRMEINIPPTSSLSLQPPA